MAFGDETAAGLPTWASPQLPTRGEDDDDDNRPDRKPKRKLRGQRRKLKRRPGRR